MLFTCPFVFLQNSKIYIFMEELIIKEKPNFFHNICMCLCMGMLIPICVWLGQVSPSKVFYHACAYSLRQALSQHLIFTGWLGSELKGSLYALCYIYVLMPSYFLWVLQLWTQFSRWHDRHFTNWTISQIRFHHSYLHPTGQERWNIHKEQAVGIWV